MTFSDAIVIYLACGSPFAVHVMMTKRDGKTFRRMLRAAGSFAGWPLLAVHHGLRLVLGKPVDATDRNSEPAQSAASLLKEMENAACIPAIRRSVFDVRDILERYAGLSEAFFSDGGQMEMPEIFDISDHPAPAVGRACLSRRTRERLGMHLNEARAEYVDLITGLVSVLEAPSSLQRLAVDIAQSVRDKQGVLELSGIFRLLPKHRNDISGYGVEPLWSTEQATTLN
jgi:hypothetical protein